MQQTNFNYIIPSEDNGISNPDTGVYTNVSTNNDAGSSTNYFINSATIIGLALILLSFIFFVIKRKENKTKAFNDGVIDLKYKNKNNIISSIFATILLLSGLITLIANIANYTTATPAPNDDFTTKKDVTTTITLDNANTTSQPITACATDTITMTNDLVGGYTLDFTASNIDPAISSITEYELTVDNVTPTTITPNETVTIKTKSESTLANDTTTVKLCVSFPEDIEPGTYTITGTYDSITNTCTANEICYNDNGANSPTTMSNQVVSEDEYNATSVTLRASNFQYTGGGYGFAGWNTKADGTGTSYGPNENITDETVLNKIKSEGLDLYAIWIPSAGNLQNWNGCNTMNIGDVTALTDTRDNNTYAVAKLADGNCWMIENLRLDNTNSDNATGALAQGYARVTVQGGGDAWWIPWFYEFSGLAEPETAHFGDATANSLYYSGTQSGTASINIIGPHNDTQYRMPRFNNQNTASPATQTTDTSANTYSYGNYYTWSAAIADTSPIYSANNQVVSSTSICPKGWRLPVGGQNTVTVGQNGDFYKLTTTLAGEEPNNPNDGYAFYDGTPAANASSKLTSFPNNFLYSGVFDGDSAYERGGGGFYWSATAGGYDNGYTLFFLDSESIVYPGTDNHMKYYGESVRCINGS